MEHTTSINIAGFRLAVVSEGSLSEKGYSPTYTPFFSTGCSVPHAQPDMVVRLIQQEIPSIGNAEKIFDSNDSWSMFENSTHVFILFNPPDLKEPLWLASVDRNFSEASVYCGKKEVHDQRRTFYNPVCYPLDQILIMNMLLKHGGALIHAACMTTNNKAFLFPGISGAGKSTLSRQLGKRQDVTLLSDDRVIVRKYEDHYTAYGTPWPGEEGIAENTGELLGAIFFILQSDRNRLIRISPKDAVKRLFPTISVPWYDARGVTMMLDLCYDMIERIPAYALYVKPGPEVMDVLEEVVYA